MQVTFLLSATELKTAQSAYSRRAHSLARRIQPWLSVTGPFLLGLTVLFEGVAFFRHPHRSPDVFSLVLAPTSLGVALVGWWRQRHSNFEPDYAKEQRFELTEDGIFRVTEGTVRVRVPWTKIGRYVEADEFFLLSSPWPWGIDKPHKPSILAKQDKPTLYILPKRAFNSADVERVRGLLQRELSVWAKNPALKAETLLTT